MTYWSYNADSRLLSIYSRDGENQPLITLSDFDFEVAHRLAAAIDKVYMQGVANARAEMWGQICNAVGKT